MFQALKDGHTSVPEACERYSCPCVWGLAVSFTTRLIYAGTRTLGAHFIRSLMGPTASMDAFEKRNVLPQPGIEPRFIGRSSSQPTHCTGTHYVIAAATSLGLCK